MLETSARRIPIALINAIISPRTYRNWRRQGSLSRPIFGRFDLVLVQNETLEKRFIRLGAPDVRVVGNMKFDAPALPVEEIKRHQLLKWIDSRPHFLAASTHQGEEGAVIEAHKELRRTYPDLLTIIVPRHPERGEEIARLVNANGFVAARRASGEPLTGQTDIYIADTLGELGLFLDLSKVTFLGGSLTENGGHNPVEVVRFGSAILTGPNWQSQADSFEALLKGEGALEILSGRELADQVAHLMKDEPRRLQLTHNAERIIGEMTGAVERTLQAITPLLPVARPVDGKPDTEHLL